MKRALIIRSGFDTPPGAHNSAECMASLIAAYGFEVTICENDAASRDGILAAIGRLIDATRQCDAAVLYYVGHGGLVINSQYVAGGPVPRYVQHLLPTDYGETSEGDFRGITAAELSRLLVRLSARSANTTAIWECCYASQLGRADDLLPEAARPALTYLGLARHYAKLRAADPGLGRLDIAGNPRVVRVAAADEFSSSFPVGLPPADELAALGIACRGGDDQIGAMTLALVRILAPLRGHRVAWKHIAPELRARLYIQRPEIDGPLDRVPFSLDVVDPGTIGVALVRDGGAVVDAGALLGVSIGDVYGVMPAGATHVDGRAIAHLTIDRVFPADSHAVIAWHGPTSTLPPGAGAIAVRHTLPRYPVRIVAPPPRAADIATRLGRAPLVRAAGPADGDVVAELRVDGNDVVLADALGPLFPPASYAGHVDDAIRDASNLATERRLRTIAGRLDSSDLTIELGVVVDDKFVRIAARDAPFALGQRVAIRISNGGAASRYVNAFGIGLRRNIALLSTDASGTEVKPGTVTVVGEVPGTGRLEGHEVKWSDGLPRDVARTESVMVVVTTDAADLRALERDENLPARVESTSLETLFEQAATGGTRGDPLAGALATPPFAMRWLDFLVVPLEGTTDFGAPVVDDAPPGLAVGTGPAGTRTIDVASTTVEPGNRIDVMVCAREHAHPIATATLACDGRARAQVWTGTAPAAIDIYAWTSQTADPRSLGDLLTTAAAGVSIAALRSPKLAACASLVVAGAARRSLAAIAGDRVITAYRGVVGPAAAAAATVIAPSFTLAVR
jgi:hypothetical protein